MTVADYKAKVPGFFTKSKRQGHGDKSYRVFRDCLIVRQVPKLSSGLYFPHYTAYRFNNDDVNWMAQHPNLKELKKLILRILESGVSSMYDLE